MKMTEELFEKYAEEGKNMEALKALKPVENEDDTDMIKKMKSVFIQFYFFRL